MSGRGLKLSHLSCLLLGYRNLGKFLVCNRAIWFFQFGQVDRLLFCQHCGAQGCHRVLGSSR